jgi:RimJ/RimL family protein N-acetyltransferase
MEINTNRLLLSKFTKEAISETYLNALNDHTIMGMTEARHIVWDRNKAEKFIDNSNTDDSILFSVIINESKKPIGNIRLFNIHKIHMRAELSLLFYDKTEWNKGYATESINAIINYAFETLKLHRIFADYYSTNQASSKIFNKAGFKIEGVFKDHFLTKEMGYVDSIRIAITNSKVNQ